MKGVEKRCSGAVRQGDLKPAPDSSKIVSFSNSIQKYSIGVFIPFTWGDILVT